MPPALVEEVAGEVVGEVVGERGEGVQDREVVREMTQGERGWLRSWWQ